MRAFWGRVLNNISVGYKMIGALLIVFLVSTAAGIFVLFLLAAQNKTTSDIQNKYISSTFALGQISAALSEHRRYSQIYQLSSDHEGDGDGFRQALEDIDFGIKKYEPLISSGAELENFEYFKREYGKYLEAVKKDLNFSISGRGEKAIEILSGQARESYDSTKAALDQNISVNITSAHQKAKHAQDLYEQGRLVIIAAGLFLLCVTGVVCLATSNMVVRPIRLLTGAMRFLAQGNLQTDVPWVERRDEIGLMAQAVMVFKTGAQERSRLEVSEQEAIAQREWRAMEIEAMTRAFNTSAAVIMERFDILATDLRRQTSALRRHSAATIAQAVQINEITSAAAAQVENVAGSTEQLSASIRVVSGRAHDGAEQAAEACSAANGTQAAVDSLIGATTRIDEVAAMIHAIAGQTNLLALNATIEAARAGEAGKGFAVVASEVKGLAAQTARATDDIIQYIADVRTATEQVVDAMRTIVDGVGGIDETTQGIAHAVYEQSQATDEIAHGAREVADGIGQVNQSMALILSSNDESGKIAGELFDIFEVLVKGWSDLDDRMKSFAREVSRL